VGSVDLDRIADHCCALGRRQVVLAGVGGVAVALLGQAVADACTAALEPAIAAEQ